MRVLDPGYTYELDQLGGGYQRFTFAPPFDRHVYASLVKIALHRTRYLDMVLPCIESKDAIEWLEMEKVSVGNGFRVQVLNQGHHYKIVAGNIPQHFVFLRRSGGVIVYMRKWPGILTQELFRAMIDHLEYVQPDEFHQSIQHLRMAFFMYELRAWRRKQEGVNRLHPAHDDSQHPRVWRAEPFEAPFNEFHIEKRQIGPDGHIIV